jgi:aminopeptidase N
LAVRRNGSHGDALVLHGERLELVSVQVDGSARGPEGYTVTDTTLTLPDVPEAFTLTTEVRIKPHENTELSGLYKSSGNYCTQCEAEGFRRITYFLDRPDVMARYRTTVEADKASYPVLLSNGNAVERADLDGGRHRVVWEDPFPKPSYLFALVAADLSCKEGTFTTASGREVKLEIWVEHQNIDACDHALVSLQKSMKWDEEVFGLEYDLDIYMIVAVSDFNMGAMENKGLNVFNAKYVLARPDTATDDDYEDVEGVIGHEYFHNWTGNRVTCRDWFQLTLKEGLTVFRDEQFTADMTSAAVKRIRDVRVLRTAQFAEDASPTAHPIRPDAYIEMNNFYTVTVYNKGSEVIRMMHTLLGPQAFRKGMDLYFERHDGQAVTCDDFRAAMADASGVDLEQFGLGTASRALRGCGSRAATTPTPRPTRSRSSSSSPPRAGLPRTRPCTCPSPRACSAPTAATCRCDPPTPG